MLKLDKFDVVIPNKDGNIWLHRALSSIYAQRELVCCVHIVDDFSKVKVLDSDLLHHPELTIKLHQNSGRGLSSARNTALPHIDAEYIALLDIDDEWLPGKLNQQLKTFQENPEIIANFVGNEFISPEGLMLRSSRPTRKKPTPRNLLQQKVVITGSASSIAIRSEYLKAIGGFDPNLTFAEDLDCWVRLSTLGEISPISLVLCRIHETPNSIQRSISHKELFKLDLTAKINIYFKNTNLQKYYASFLGEYVFVSFIRKRITWKEMQNIYSDMQKKGITSRMSILRLANGALSTFVVMTAKFVTRRLKRCSTGSKKNTKEILK
jgi:glycosyltransferase involved in cell wall biosynthesis